MNWRKSRLSGPVGNCYLVARPEDDLILLSDSKLGDKSPVHPFTLAGWLEIISNVMHSESLAIGLNGMQVGQRDEFAEAIVERMAVDEFTWHCKTDIDQPALTFTLAEHEAFLYGVGDETFVPIEEGGDLDVDRDKVASLATVPTWPTENYVPVQGMIHRPKKT